MFNGSGCQPTLLCHEADYTFRRTAWRCEANTVRSRCRAQAELQSRDKQSIHQWVKDAIAIHVGRPVHAAAQLLGRLGELTWNQLVSHPTVRALVLASNLDARPDCVNCAYNPYCGACPVHTYKTQGSLVGRMRESTICMVHKGIQDFLFEKLRENDPTTVGILRRWTTVRERTHFVHESAAS